GLFPVQRDAESFENLCRPSQNMFGFGSSSTGHHPVIRPPCELIPLPPHLLVKGSEKDIAQQRRDHPALRGSPWGCILAALLLVARRERLLNELQHPAIPPFHQTLVARILPSVFKKVFGRKLPITRKGVGIQFIGCCLRALGEPVPPEETIITW